MTPSANFARRIERTKIHETPYGNASVEDLVAALEAEVQAHRATRRELEEARNLIAAMREGEKS